MHFIIFFLDFPPCFNQYFVKIAKNIPFPIIWHVLHPKQCTRIHYLIVKTSLIMWFLFKRIQVPPGGITHFKMMIVIFAQLLFSNFPQKIRFVFFWIVTIKLSQHRCISKSILAIPGLWLCMGVMGWWEPITSCSFKCFDSCCLFCLSFMYLKLISCHMIMQFFCFVLFWLLQL